MPFTLTFYNHAVDYMSEYVDWTLASTWIYEKYMRMRVGMTCRHCGSLISWHHQAAAHKLLFASGATEQEFCLQRSNGNCILLKRGNMAIKKVSAGPHNYCQSQDWSSFKEGKHSCWTKTDIDMEMSNIYICLHYDLDWESRIWKNRIRIPASSWQSM